jgi:hypothetical protein
MKYNIGDVVQMNSTWDKRYGIIINIDDARHDFPPVYRILVQAIPNPLWLDKSAILGKVE